MATLAKAPAKKAAKTVSAKKVTMQPPSETPAPSRTTPKSTEALSTLTITSKNYSSWSLRGWLLAQFSGLPFKEHVLPPDDPSARAEILLLSSSILVPSLEHNGIRVWDTLAIAEYLNEACPQAHMLPSDPKARAHCRAISGEMHSGFAALRSALPMNLRGHFPKFKVWSRAQADIDRITSIWRECLDTYGGPFLFGPQRTIADAMYAPVCTRFITYDVKLDPVSAAYRDLMLKQPEMQEWLKAAKLEPLDIDELDVEF
jgi:glutathione S-transferase